MSGTRGQTTLDFAFGVSIFLIVLLFVFLFVPDLLEPFTTGTQEETVAVNRIADELSQRQLGSAATPYVLNATCTAAFFSGSPPGDCNYEGTNVPEQLDLEFRQSVNVTITASDAINVSDPSNVLCWNQNSKELTTVSSCSGSPDPVVPLRTGEELQQGSGSSVAARRIAVLDGRAVSIKVVMW